MLDEQFIKMPAGASIISAQLQNGVPTLWAVVEVGDGGQSVEVIEERCIAMIGTGRPMDDMKDYEHLGTALMMDGELVEHIFAVRTWTVGESDAGE